MSIPRPSALHKVIVEEIRARGGKVRLADLYDPLTKKFPQLTSADLQRRTPSGSNWWQGYIRFALDALKKKGEVTHLTTGVWGVSPPRSPRPIIEVGWADDEDKVHTIQIALPSGGKAALRVPRNITDADVELIHRILSSVVRG